MIIIVKCSAGNMESHTLEILQQGVWASLTGGWFYDLRQNVFCNTFHLYLWLFLLCFPFILHLYFVPNLTVYSFYCGTVCILFTTLKLLNHRLHRIFDTTECIQEIVPGDDLPESQKKKSQSLRQKSVLEDEGIELQVLGDSKTADGVYTSSFNEGTDDDSVVSLEVGARTISSTIDLKVDVHRKNSSETSEELSLKPVIEHDMKAKDKIELIDPLTELNAKQCDNVRLKHKLKNNNLRLKSEDRITGFDGNDFALSQSDCYIAKHGKKSLEELTKECKMSQSDCHISKLRQNSTNKEDEKKKNLELSCSMQCECYCKEKYRRKCCYTFCRHHNTNAQTSQNTNATGSSKYFGMGNVMSGSSCGVLTLNQCVNKDGVMNTGSLELPLKDIDNSSNSEKGLLYWKQQYLDRTNDDSLNNSEMSTKKESNDNLNTISESDCCEPVHPGIKKEAKLLNKTDEPSAYDILDHSTSLSNENDSESSQMRDKSFLELLEENFDWCDSDYQIQKAEKLTKPKESCRYRSDEGGLVDGKRMDAGLPCSFRLQVDSDEDLSDNCGSQSPLLCRHESLEKGKAFVDPLLGESSGEKPSRTLSGDQYQNCNLGKFNRTLSMDDNVVLSNRFKNSKKVLINSGKNCFSSFLLTELDENEKVDGDNSKCAKSDISDLHLESFFQKNADCAPCVWKNDKVASVKSDGEAAEDLFRCTDPPVSGCCCCGVHECDKDDTARSQPVATCSQSQGAIPKTTVIHSEGNQNSKGSDSHNKGQVPATETSSTTTDSVGRGVKNSKIPKGSKRLAKIERENGFIDEEESEDVFPVCGSASGGRPRHQGNRKGGDPTRESYGSSNNSTTELCSLLPLSSLLSSLHPPTSPLLAAFLAARKECADAIVMPPVGPQPGAVMTSPDEREDKNRQHVTFVRSRHKRSKRTPRTQRTSRSARVSSFPMAALASAVGVNSETHIATGHDDTTPGAIHCFQDEKGNWMSYTFDSPRGTVDVYPSVSTRRANDVGSSADGGVSDAQAGADRDVVHPQSSTGRRLQASDHVPFASRTGRDSDYGSFGSEGGPSENLYGRQSSSFDSRQPGGFCRRRGVQNAKAKESGIGAAHSASNQISENVRPGNSDSGTVVRPTFTSFMRDRFIISQRHITRMSNNLNILTAPTNTGSVTMNLNEFHNNDRNNNNDNSSNNGAGASSNNNNTNNDSNNNVNDSNNNNNNSNGGGRNNVEDGENSGDDEGEDSNGGNCSGSSRNPGNRDDRVAGCQRSNSGYYQEGTGGRSPFGPTSDTFFDSGNRRRNSVFHGPGTMQDSSHLTGSLSQAPGSDKESERNHFRLFDFDDLDGNVEVKRKSRHFYKLYYTPWNYVKVRFDRLELMALLDRNLTIFEIVISLFLSFAVSVCGIVLLNCGFYRDLFAFLFCFVLAGCQYSLLKSVQPDATSPTHGYNRVVIYSRSIYFCATSLLIFSLTSYIDKKPAYSFQFYAIHFTDDNAAKMARDGLVNLLLFFPVLFTLGLFPQINTFCLYLLEQIDMHVFGGNAMSSLVGAVYCVSRSIVTAVFIYGFAYGALSEVKTSQHILFSIFTALLISLSYHLSRSTSNPTMFWDILKDHLFQDELRDKARSREGETKGRPGTELDKSINESMKSEDRNSQNNLLLSSNPSSNDIVKVSEHRAKSNSSGTLENFGSCSVGSDGVTENKPCDKEEEEEGFVDPLPQKLRQTVNGRLKNDVIVCCIMALLVFGIHSSTLFTTLQPDLNPILWGIAGCSGFVLHYVVPELRKHLPWLCLSGPVLRGHEHTQFEVRGAARVMWFEETYVILCFLERNLLYPVLVLATLTYDGPRICNKFGIPLGALFTCICGLKVMRSAFSNTSQQYLIVVFAALIFQFDFYSYSETFLVDYFFVGIIFSKMYEFLLKVQFVIIYIAPWQITWGSAFHAFAQPFSVPHSAMLFVQAALSAVLSAPLNPFLGSAIFLTSYVRPIKFWERDYNTKRVDHSNTRMSSHLERNLGSDDNNLNSIFYEHLTRSLQHSLCGDLELGRWGPVTQGDCFVLASDYLNCLVHIIEIGNGLVTFQMRGLEFRGTYCQQREVEAISERSEDDDGCCCCEPCHIPHILSVNAAFSKRWLAWEVTASKYVLEGYSISDNSAASTLQVFDFRKVLVTYYVKSIIFYCIRSPKLQGWLTNPTILRALEPLAERSFVDLDPVFNINIDQDFDIRAEGITRNSFCSVYLEWIQYCSSKREKQIDKSLEAALISLCLALSLIGRRTLGTASHNTVSSVEFFLYGLHALFKGDFRITSTRDDWIFADMEFLMKVVAPGVRMSLKLHQDHFMSPEEYEDPSALFEAISNHEENLVISHEGDPAWRSAVLSGTPSLLALRHVLDDGSDEYKIIMLNKRFLSFRVIKLNRECVRGLWAGQQQELVFLRNRNPERGSIQNAKQVLRNMINSSCDQPIGYPIYVSPLTTSYSDTNKQLTAITGGPLSLLKIKKFVLKMWRRIGQRCREGCSSGSVANADEGGGTFGQEGIYAMTNVNVHSGYGHNTSGSQSMDSSQMQLSSSNRGGSLGRSSLGGRGSLASVGKPSSATLASLAGLLSSAELPKGECFLRERETSLTFLKERQSREEKDCGRKADEKDRKRDDKEKTLREKMVSQISGDHCDEPKEKENVYQRVRIIHPNLVYDAINLGRRIDVLWPDEGMRLKGGRSYWRDWLPDAGMEGQVVHRWVPNHRDPAKRSHVDKTILLVKVDDKFVPIAETGVQDLGVEV